jgi:hypothetical protein
MTNHLIWATGLVAHLLLLAALFRRKHAADFPSFTLLIAFYVLRSIGLMTGQLILHHAPAAFVLSLLDLADVLLQSAVLAELIWRVLGPLPLKRRLTMPLLLLASGVLIMLRLAPHRRFTYAVALVLAHFLLSLLMVQWAVATAFLLRPLRRSWRSPAAAISLGFGIYSAALLAGGGYFTTGRDMSDYVFFSYFRIGMYLAVVLFWTVSLWLSEREHTQPS